MLSLEMEVSKEEINEDVLKKIYDKIKNILKEIEEGKITFELNKNKKDYSITYIDEKNISCETNDYNNKVVSEDNSGIKNIKVSNLLTYSSNFLDAFYSQKENVSLLKNAKQNLERDINSHISKINKKLALVLKNLDEEPNLEKYRQYGELISCNIYRMQIGMDKLIVENFYDNNKEIEIPLQNNLSPSRNAQKYFKKYNKIKGSIAHAKEYKAIYEAELEYLNSVLFEINECNSIFELDDVHEELVNSGYTKKSSKRGKKKDTPSEPLSYEYNGVRILVGRNNIQNDKLTLKTARKNYTWLHTKKVHGSHVIIESENVDDELLYYAATLAKEHSNAKNSSKVEVDYTLVKYVHKEAGAKPGMVVYTDYKTIVV